MKIDLNKLRQAADLIAEVQVPMTFQDDSRPREYRTENWKTLFTLRSRVIEEMYRLKNLKSEEL